MAMTKQEQFSRQFWMLSSECLAAVIWLSGCSGDSEVNEGEIYERIVEGSVFDTEPVRGEVRPLKHRRGKFEYACTECHKDFGSKLTSKNPKGEHSDLVLDHGHNTLCLNCHHKDNRNVYVDYDGSEIAEGDTTLLCRKCHGPTYREWQVGIHGRQNGYWDSSKGPRKKLQCIQCHDPHSPVFKPMAPEPAPQLDRMASAGDQHETGEQH